MKTFVFCIDALFTRDLGTLRAHPKLAPLFSHAVAVKDIEAIYPTLTYPTHVSIVTGVPAKVHGIIANQPLNPATENDDWFWYYRQIQSKTVFDALHEKGFTTCAVFWPVTAAGPIDYLVPEIWGKDNLKVVKENSSHNIDDILEAHKEILSFGDKLMQDTYGCLCTEDIIHRYNPDVVFVHFCLIDHTRHVSGINHPDIQRDLNIMGDLFGRMMDAVHDVQKEEPNIVILGDHGHIDYAANLMPNVEFEKLGWVSRDKPEDYMVYCHGCGISAHVYLRNPALAPQAEVLFEKWKHDGYLREYFPREKAAEMGLDGAFAYVLEAADGYSIVTTFGNQFVNLLPLPEGVTGFGNHGHLPQRGNKPPFLVSSPAIKEYKEVEGGNMLDIAPTLCVMNGVPLWPMHGKAMESISRYYPIENR